jgi:hypothetical protein
MSSQGGGFFYRFHGILTSEKYVQILENFLVPYAWARFGQTEDNPVPFVQDRSPIHRSYLIRKRFEDQGKEFDVLPWSPFGPQKERTQTPLKTSVAKWFDQWICSIPQAATNCEIRFTIFGNTLTTVKITGELFATRCLLVDLQLLGK